MPSSRRLILATSLTLAFCCLILPTTSGAGNASDLERPQDGALEDLGLRLLAPSMELEGNQATVLVQAFRPSDQKPIAQLPVHLEIEVDNGDGVGTDGNSIGPIGSHVVVTDHRGTATLRFSVPRIPPNPSDDGFESEITVTAHANWRGVEQSVAMALWALETPVKAEVSTDRRVYQAGQTVHLRGLWRDDAWTPQNDRPVRLTLFGPEHQALAHLEGRTSAVGVAAWDWRLPATAVPGTYRVQARSGTEQSGTKPDGSGLDARTRFEVLPAPSEIRLEAHPKQSVVLPNDQPEIEVWAQDADGNPVAGALVEVVERVVIGASESDRGDRPLRPLSRDDAHGQVTLGFGAFGGKETPTNPSSPAQSGRTDAEGRLLITLTDLEIAFDRIDARWGGGYRDLIFEARLTHPGTGLVLAAPFELRLSHDAVHLHVEGSAGDRGLPDDVYLFAQHADGTPASCWVEVRRPDFPAEHQVVGRVRANDLGAASLEDLPLDPLNRYELVALGDGPDTPPLGTAEVSLARQQEMRLLIERSLLQIGEDIHMELHVADPRPHLQAFVWNADGELLTHRDALSATQSQRLVFPFRGSFQGVLTVQVVDLLANTRPGWSQPSTSRAVVFPGQAGPALEVSVHPSPAGDMAQIDLQLTGTRNPAVVALAVTTAPEGHGRPDGLEAQPSLPGDSGWENYDPWDLRLGGWSLERLLQLPEDQRYGDAAQVVARGLLGDGYFRPQGSVTSHPVARTVPTLDPHAAADHATHPESPSLRSTSESMGQLAGVVREIDGKPLPDVRITLLGNAGSWEEVSDEDGFYRLSLPTGSYQVDVHATDWLILRYDEIWVLSDQTVYLPTLIFPDDEIAVIGTGSPDESITEATSTPSLGTTLLQSGTVADEFSPELLVWLAEEDLGTDGQWTADIPLPPTGYRWHIAALASDSAGHLIPAQMEWAVESKQ